MMISHWQSFKKFCAEMGVVTDPDDIEKVAVQPPAVFAKWMSLWIMDR